MSDVPDEPPYDPEAEAQADPFVAHETPEVGTSANRRLLLFGVVPIVAIVVAGLIYFLVR